MIIKKHDEIIISPAIAAPFLDPLNVAIARIELSITIGMTKPAKVAANRARSWVISAAKVQQGVRFASSVGVTDVTSDRTDI